VKNSRLYLFLALIMVVSLAIASGCSKVTPEDKTPVVPAAPGSVTAPVVAPVAGPSDLVVTKVWLDGLMIYYTVKNTGVGDSPQTYAHIFVNDLFPTMGGSSFVDVLKPGQERTLNFSNYEWPYGKNSSEVTAEVKVNPSGYIELSPQNQKVKVCADAKNEAIEAVETNNCKVTLLGILWEYNLLPVEHLANWRNSVLETPEAGNETSVQGAHFKVANADMEMLPQLVMVPQQIPQGWIQGTWGYFNADEYGSPRSTALQMPAKVHFVARVGLTRNAIGSDGVTFKFGVKDLSDTVTWIASKKATTPAILEDWDVNLSEYEGQRLFFILRVEAGASPAKDFAIWNQARLLQVND